MMRGDKSNSIKGGDKMNESFGASVRHLAKSHGWDLQNLEHCKIEGITVDCTGDRQQKSDSGNVRAIYNPNLEVQRGIFLRVEKSNSNLTVERIDYTNHMIVNVPTELFCTDSFKIGENTKNVFSKND